ncbi:MAG: hypothetical protein J6Z50_06665 [Fibrobacterales bacterium]|nr:hypothetical protein [Fibrobacterales bacterium]
MTKTAAPLFLLCLALLSCGKEEPPADESLPLDLREFPWSTMVLGCGVPLNFATDKPLSSFEALESAGCDTVKFSKERHRDKWEELERLGECSDDGGEIDYRAIFRDGASGRIVLGIGREGRVIRLEDGRRCSVSERNVLDVCRIYNELFETPESQVFCPVPAWFHQKTAADSGSSALAWRESDWAWLKGKRAELGDSAVAVYGTDLNALRRGRVDPAWLVEPGSRRALLTPAQVRRFVEPFRETGGCSLQRIPMDYRAFGIDMRGRFVFGIDAHARTIRAGAREYYPISDEKRPLLRLMYEELFPDAAPRAADARCDTVTKAVVDFILREDMKCPSHFENGSDSGCPFDLFRKELRKGSAGCRTRRLAQTLRFLDGYYPELVLPDFTESFLLAAKNREKIVWDEDLCLALWHIFGLCADELIEPLAKAGFTYDALDKRCHYGEPQPTPPPPLVSER